MRASPTSSEARLFSALRGKRLGVTFRRQVPLLGRFIADLYASELRLVVEIDGGYHLERAERDARRERALVGAGYHLVRVTDSHVMIDLGSAVASIRAEIALLRARAIVR